MTRRSISGRLELTWMGKDKALIPSAEGVYDYDWVDQNDPRACQTHYLIDEGHVGDPDDGGIHDNLLVTGESGDVLEALTRVPELAEKYVGRVKCVYIDPPFNTAGTFTHYEDNLEHSVWLTMMRDRLLLLKELLADDGSIWVHLDDSENHRMRVLLDEVFGAGNFIAEFVWEKAQGARNDTDISSAHDTITVYRASAAYDFKSVRNLLPRSAVQIARYQNPDGDPRGPWRQGDNGTAKSGSEAARFPIELPSGRQVVPPPGSYWRFSRASFEEARAEGRVWFGAQGDSLPVVKRYLSEVQDGVVPRTWWPATEVGSNQEAKRDHLRKLFPDVEAFSTPKPERLLERILTIATNPGELVLDCFAGSGTTAAVAHKMGRRWVTCELLPATVAAFTRPRLEKVVANEDLGGITSKSEYEPVGSLPGGTTVEEAQTTSTVIGRAVKALNEAGIELDATTVKALKQSVATKKVTTTQWAGGGGFDVARLSPVWVGVEETPFGPSMFTTPEATGEVLARSIAAHLGFRWTGDRDLRFAGSKGRQRLAVLEGVLTTEKVDELVTALGDDETVTVACFGVEDGVHDLLRRASRGSRIRVIPDDLFNFNPDLAEESDA